MCYMYCFFINDKQEDDGERKGDMKRMLKRYMYKHRFIVSIVVL